MKRFICIILLLVCLSVNAAGHNVGINSANQIHEAIQAISRPFEVIGNLFNPDRDGLRNQKGDQVVLRQVLYQLCILVNSLYFRLTKTLSKYFLTFA